MTKNKWGIESMPKSICAIDASTNSLAFALFDTQQKTLGAIGKINFEGKDTYQKVMDAGKKVKAFLDFYGGVESIVIEQTVYLNSIDELMSRVVIRTGVSQTTSIFNF